MTETAARLIKLAEVYITQDPNQKDHVTKIMLAKGIVVQMQSDLILFEKKKGKNERSYEQQHRIDLLKSAIDTFSEVSSNNLQIGHILYAYNNEIKAHRIKIAQLENEIKMLNKQINFQ